MKKTSKITILVISLAMLAGYFLPLWEITLEAPQYPEGLGMNIWVNKITGDLQTINGLNHYIGMKTIEPDSIKELSIMPYILGGLIAFGLVTGLIGKKKVLMLFVIVFVILGVAGGVDFYMWEYDYGHNLNPDAAIKIPGMSYQPPLFGTKELLNFVATSLPAAGGWIIMACGFASVAVLMYELIFNRIKKGSVKA